MKSILPESKSEVNIPQLLDDLKKNPSRKLKSEILNIFFEKKLEALTEIHEENLKGHLHHAGPLARLVLFEFAYEAALRG
ncbi:hypothetical protein PY247_10445 [Acinetobacter proteolyticus]|nr:hypothetical protein [Acinetobacter proteolyticus]WEI20093.1 hypothetical protein PY247_10445 [Acinetobacter proteolyticus]